MSITNCPFRGTRDYFHSASLFGACLAHLRERGIEPTDIDFIFNKRVAVQADLTDDPVDGPLVAAFSFDGGKVSAIETNVPITRNEPYDEDGLAATFIPVDGGLEVDLGKTTNPFIDCVVAAFKAVLLKRDSTKKYVFARMKLQRIPNRKFSVLFSRPIGRFLEGSIQVDGVVVGQIYYGVWSSN